MGSILNFLELLAMALWTGSIVFFSFFVAPVLFRALGKPEAGKAVRAVFPRYYLLGIFCGVTLVVVQLGRGLLWYWGGMILPALVIFTLLTLVTLYARQVLIPAITSGEKPRSDTLHRRSVMLNGFVLLLLLLYLVWMAQRGY
jgi:hypothetical protein